MRLLAIVLALALSIAAPGLAGAQERDGAAEAEALFREAKRLIDQRRYDEACPKLEQSQRLDPAGGTALTLGLCHQAAGRLATAIARLEAALAFAERDGRADRARVAREAIAKLMPIVSRLAVRVDTETASLPDLVVERDGVRIDPAAFGVPVPVDGGAHTIVAAARDHRRVELRITIAPREETRTVDVPVLERLPAEPAPKQPAAPPPPRKPAPRPPAQAEGGSSTRLAFTVASFGLAAAGVAVATVFGLRARAGDEEADTRCPEPTCSDATGVALNEEARRDAWIATAGAGAAVAGGLVGAILLLGRPSPAAPGAITATLSPSALGLSVGGAF